MIGDPSVAHRLSGIVPAEAIDAVFLVKARPKRRWLFPALLVVVFTIGPAGAGVWGALSGVVLFGCLYPFTIPRSYTIAVTPGAVALIEMSRYRPKKPTHNIELYPSTTPIQIVSESKPKFGRVAIELAGVPTSPSERPRTQ